MVNVEWNYGDAETSRDDLAAMEPCKRCGKLPRVVVDVGETAVFYVGIDGFTWLVTAD